MELSIIEDECFLLKTESEKLNTKNWYGIFAIRT